MMLANLPLGSLSKPVANMCVCFITFYELHLNASKHASNLFTMSGFNEICRKSVTYICTNWIINNHNLKLRVAYKVINYINFWPFCLLRFLF